MNRLHFFTIVCLLFVAEVGVPAYAGWTVTILTPASADAAYGSYAYGVSGGHQVGWALFGGHQHAGIWGGTAASWVDLNPPGATQSYAYGISGGQQVGSANLGPTHAGLWSGTAASWVDLHPPGATESVAWGVSGGQQVGRASFGGHNYAGLWSGTAASWVDLHPPGATESEADAISGGQQVGWASFDGNPHASLWSGTAASWVDLNPPGASWSYACNVSGGQQVGYANLGPTHAGLWSGTAASWVDLHPPVATESQALGISGGQQVGYATVFTGSGYHYHACLWSGTAESWVDLHSLLPSGVYPIYLNSKAEGIYTSGDGVFVVGAGYKGEGTDAILWSYVPEPLVTDDGIYTENLTRLHAFWSLTGVTVQEYQYAVGTSPSSLIVDWTSTGTATEATETGLSLEPGQTYYWYVKARLAPGWGPAGQSDGITALTPASVGAAKSGLVGSPVFITDAIATSGSSDFPGLWIESSDRSAGIFVSGNLSLDRGVSVHIAGVPSWSNGIPTLANPELKDSTPGTAPRPLGITNSALANDRDETLTYDGLSTVGLLMKTWGKVARVDTTAHVFYINDGSMLADGMGPSYDPFIGVRVAYKAGMVPPTPNSNKNVRVTGIRTIEKVTLQYDAFVNGKYRFAGETLYLPVLSLRDQLDIWPPN